MRTLNLTGSTALGIIIGAVVFNAPAALADWPVIDLSSIAKEVGIIDAVNAVKSVNDAINSGISDFNKAIGLNTYGDTNTLLRQGFTQNANYSKAQIGAQQQIVDAQNTVMSQFQLGIRQAQIRDEQTPSPTQCTALDGGVGTQAAAVQAYDLAATLAGTHDLRGEASQGMPSYLGTRQGVQSSAANHIALYCDTTDQAAGICSNGVSTKPDADQRSSSLFGAGTYADQASVVAAKDFAINLIEPVAPAALRGDQLNSLAGQDAAVQRRSFNARMSLAQSFVDEAIGMQSPSIPTTPLQQQYLTNLGLPVPANLSWFQALQIESERRISDVTWNATLASLPPAAVEREIASEMALSNYLAFQNLKVSMKHTTIGATQLAETAEQNFMPTVRMAAPAIISN